MKLYFTRPWGSPSSYSIVEASRESQTSVWIDGSKRSKASQYALYFKSLDDLKKYHVTRLQSHIAALRSQMDDAEALLREAESIKTDQS